MPLTLKPKDTILDSIVSSILAGNIISDLNKISVTRQFSEGTAATVADLYYELYVMLQGWYRTTAEGVDLDIRGLDMNVPRNPGQAASDAVTFTALTNWIDDSALPAPQVVQATLADGTAVLYRSVGDMALLPSGRSVSGALPATTLTSGSNDHLALNLDGDGVRTPTLGTQTTGAGVAAAIQAAVRALTANNASHQTAYSQFRCDFGVTTAGRYTLRSGTAGPSSAVVVSVAGTSDASAALKLGVAQGGTEQAGQSSIDVPVICDQIGVIGNVAAGQINQFTSAVAGVSSVANLLAFSNGREQASDDAYRQDIRSYLLALGRGTRDAIERAVARTVSADGQQHVLSSQVLDGAGTIAVYICDGRSLTVGAQDDVILDVQQELDGLGVEPGGWVPSGNKAGVAAALILPVNVTAEVVLGPTPDLVTAQQAITNALFQLLYSHPVGQAMTYGIMTTRIDQAVAEMLDVRYSAPTQFTLAPPLMIGGGIGQKVMPGTLTITTVRG